MQLEYQWIERAEVKTRDTLQRERGKIGSTGELTGSTGSFSYPAMSPCIAEDTRLLCDS
jgi:hypothetical protein